MGLVAWTWIGLAALSVVIELHAQTVYLIAVAAGLFLGGLLGWAGFRLEVQVIAIVVVLAAGFPLAHWVRARQPRHALRAADVGLEVEVVKAGPGGLRVRYRGTEWSGTLAGAAAAPGERLRITGLDGSTLQLARPEAARRDA